MDAGRLPSPEERAILDEEERLLERARAAIAKARERDARGRSGTGRAAEALRALRDQALESRAEDLPALLQDMSMQHRLARRQTRILPDERCPYIGHLRVHEDGKSEDYLLGHVSFFGGGVAILDWRVAPLARIFYRYREGDEYEEEFPGRLAEGLVEARRIVVVEDGRLTRVVGDETALVRGGEDDWRSVDRGSLAFASGGAGTAARPGVLGVGVGTRNAKRSTDVTALLDREQYEAISAPPERPLLVLGSAGSGKTTVALHRLAQILANEGRRFPRREARVLVPEPGLARLSRRLLEPLGFGADLVKTVDAWSEDAGRRTFGRALKLCREAPPLVTGLKRHPATYHALLERFATSPRPRADLASLRDEVAEAFSDRGFLDRVVADAGGDLPTTAIEETLRHTVIQLSEPIEGMIDRDQRRTADGLDVADDTPDAAAGTVDVEDVPILLHRMLEVQSPESLALGRVSVLVVDESEDASLFELSVLRGLRRRVSSVTLAGDEAQQTLTSFAGWEDALEAVGARDASICRLATSYRCPRPIAELARTVLGPLAPPQPAEVSREGAPVGRFELPTEAQAQLFLEGALRDLREREPRASVAVVAASASTARRIHALLADHPAARLVLDGDFTFEPGIDVTDVENVKGLEFDYVVVPDATATTYPPTNESRRRLHVAVTRASHQLWLVAGGSFSSLL